jgi:hypothetical protein
MCKQLDHWYVLAIYNRTHCDLFVNMFMIIIGNRNMFIEPSIMII